MSSVKADTTLAADSMVSIESITIYSISIGSISIESDSEYSTSNGDTSIESILIDNNYSSNTHERYHYRFKNFENRTDFTAKWDSLLGVDDWGSVNLYKNVRRDINVFGWHPYWAEQAVEMYDYELLTMVSYFGYEFNANDGTVKNDHGWKDTKLHEKSRSTISPVKIYLTVFSYNLQDNTTFLDSDEAMIQLVDDVDHLLEEENAHGVTLDFQNIPKESSEQYTKLLKRFYEMLEPKGREIIMVIPAADPDSIYQVNEMAEYLDYLIVMGYDFHGKGKKKGPFSVLYETDMYDEWSIEKRVTDLLADSTTLDSTKVLISLGWIGSLYEKTDSTKKHKGYRSLSFMNNMFQAKDSSKLTLGGYDFKEDKASRSNYIEYSNEDNGNLMTYYFTDSTSFDYNLDWIQQQGLGGVAIWTLADAGNITGYWKAIADLYGKSPWRIKIESILSRIMDSIIIPVRLFLVNEWLNPFLSLFISTLLTLFSLIVLVYVIYKKRVPDWLEKAGVFIPFIISIIMVLSLSHDFISHFGVDRYDDPFWTRMSIGFGSFVLLISLWFCYRVYYLGKIHTIPTQLSNVKKIVAASIKKIILIVFAIIWLFTGIISSLLLQNQPIEGFLIIYISFISIFLLIGYKTQSYIAVIISASILFLGHFVLPIIFFLPFYFPLKWNLLFLIIPVFAPLPGLAAVYLKKVHLI